MLLLRLGNSSPARRRLFPQRSHQLAVAQRWQLPGGSVAMAFVASQRAAASSPKRRIDAVGGCDNMVRHAAMLAAPLLAGRDARARGWRVSRRARHHNERQGGGDAAVADAHARPVLERLERVAWGRGGVGRGHTCC